ncbi:MAG TPA: zinc ribbon domain-containing protein [Roseiflexaceae bacterium]|nr:zinc ribbon domain-containing protein [Roseiflexaceae bacterium]
MSTRSERLHGLQPCARCRTAVQAQMLFCPACGAPLRPAIAGVRIRPIDPTRIEPRRTHAVPAATPNQAVRHVPATRAVLQAAGALCFSIVFLVGLQQFIAHGGVPALGLWALAPLVLGALVAEEAWVQGHMAAGLLGLVTWSALPWLLAIDMALPWGYVLALVWLIVHVQNVRRWRRNATLSSRPTAAMVVSEKLPP